MFKAFLGFAVSVCLSPFFVQAQGKASVGSAGYDTLTSKLALTIYRQALSLNDYTTAQYALHQLIVLDKNKPSAWRDTLLRVYSGVGAWESAHLLSSNLLRERPSDNILLEIDANALRQLGASREAIAAYEMLYNRTSNARIGYILSLLQYDIKRLAEAESTLKEILNKDISKEEIIVFPTPTGGQQSVSLKAAMLNLRGLVAFDLKQNETALDYFQQALQISPDFAAAKQNEQTLQGAITPPVPKE